MANINDALIKKYQEWYKDNNGRSIDKYTARAHLKKMSSPSRTTGGSRM
jgi:hypothetical protein